MVNDPASTDEEEAPPLAEMGERYRSSRMTSYALIVASISLVAYALVVDVSESQASLIGSIITLTNVVTVAWISVANGREAWVEGQSGKKI